MSGHAAGIALVLAALLAVAPAGAQETGRRSPDLAGQDVAPADATPEALAGIAFEQRLGEPVPLDLTFRDESGRPVTLGSLLGDRPVVLSPVYFSCPMLCPMTLSGLAGSLKALTFDVGEELDVVVASFNPAETPADAAEAKRRTVGRYGRAGSEEGWHFLTGEPEAIAALMDAIGFRYEWDGQRQEFAHASGVVLLTPEGRIARYFFGIDYPPKDLRFGLIEASSGRIGTLVDDLLLYCFHYDAQIGRYSAVTMNVLRLAGAATVLALAGFVLVMLRQERKRSRTPRTA